jgi:hypothetical protein
MEHEGSLLRLQEPATGPCPEPDASNPHIPPRFPKIHSNIILPSTPASSEWSLHFRFSSQDIVNISHISYAYACYTPLPYHSP